MKNPLILSILLFISYLSFSQPVNDTCTTAVTLTAGTTCTYTAGTLYNAKLSPVTGLGNCGNRRDVWYRFTVPALSSSVRIAVSLTSSPSTLTVNNTSIELLTGNACSPADSTRGGCSNISATRTYGGLTPGATYLFRVYTSADVTSGGSSAYNFNICVTSNDDCATATPITPGSTVEGSVFGASTTAGIPVGCSTGAPDDDVWYKFTAVYSYATIMASNIGSNLSSSGVRMQLLSGSCGSLNSVACGTNAINSTGLTPGNTYYCRIYSAGSAQTGANWGFQMSVFPSANIQVTAGRMKEVYNQQILSAPQALLDPWEVTYGPDNKLWITESKGYRVYKIDPTTGVRDTVLDISSGSIFLPLSDTIFNCKFSGTGAQGGCAGLALHPKFLDATAPKNFVYLSYVYSYTGSSVYVNRVVRFTYNTGTGKLESPLSLCDTLPGSNDHNSQRIIIAPVGSKHYLFYASGDMGAGQFNNLLRNNKAQLLNSYEGKILRFNLESDGDPGALDRWIPSTGSGDETNPYNATLGVQSAVWSVGMRNNQGFAYDPVLNKLYGSSHGPFSDDEINVVERGGNYGHPLVIGYAADGNVNNTTAGAAPGMPGPDSSSCPIITNEVTNAAAIGSSYRDPLFSGYPSSTVFPSITTLWNTTDGSNAQWPSEGWSGLELYTHTLIPGWNKSLIAASLKWGRLVRLRLDSTGTATFPTNTAADTTSYFGSINRFRDLAFSPDGKDIYVVMDRSTSSSGPSAANPIIPACQGCIQKYSFLGYNDAGGKSSIPTSIDVTDGIANVCNTGTTVTINSANNNLWVPITGPDGNIMAEIYPNGQNLGTVTSSFYKNVGAIRTKGSARYLNRNITITPQNQPSGSVKIRLYFSKAEYDSLDADPLSQVSTLSDIKIYKNSTPCENRMTVPSAMINPVFSEAHGGSAYMLQADISGFSSFYFGASNLALPLNLISFTGNYKNEISYLNWKTNNELNTDYFVVERSIGNSVYESIGTVFATGGSGEKASYAFEDKDAAMLGTDKLYYRLKITDKNGSYSYSNIVAINIPVNLAAKVSVFPNPADKQAIVIVSSPKEQRITWQLVDMAGRIVLSKDIVIKKGDNRIILDLERLKAGVYYLKVNGPLVNALEKIQKL